MSYYLATSPVYLRRWSAPRQVTQPHAGSLPVNVREDGDAFILSALVPGLAAEDLTIQVLDDVVTIEGEHAADGDAYLLRELPHGAFRRSLRLPLPLDAAAAEAELKNGILTLRVPKAEEARPKSIRVVAR